MFSEKLKEKIQKLYTRVQSGDLSEDCKINREIFEASVSNIVLEANRENRRND